MANVPHDLINEILVLLPVKSLLRFRCICKSWYEIISSRDFIYSHLDKSSIRKLIQIRGAGTSLTRVCAIDINNGIQEKFKLNYEMSNRNLYNAAYCNGLVLFEKDYKFSVWNPSTRHYRKLPEVYQLHGRAKIFGFGYDVTTDDYKVVIINFPLTVSSSCEVWIFGFKSSRMRKISDFPSNYIDGYRNSFVDGCVNFLSYGKGQGSYIIMAFDVAKETSYVVPLPIYQGRGYPTSLQVFEGCLSIKIYTEDKVDVYVRKKDGVEFSWTNLFSLRRQQSSVFGLNGSLFNMDFTTLRYSKEGDKIVLLYRGKIYLYDLKQESLQVPEWQSSIIDLSNCMYCEESLVSIGS